MQEEAPDIHLSTIYRNLDELEKLGVIVHAHLGHGPATYHLASSAHGHFVCEECGAMIEAPDSLFGGLAKAAKTKFDFTIDPHHFAMLGRCADCVRRTPRLTLTARRRPAQTLATYDGHGSVTRPAARPLARTTARTWARTRSAQIE